MKFIIIKILNKTKKPYYANSLFFSLSEETGPL